MKADPIVVADAMISRDYDDKEEVTFDGMTDGWSANDYRAFVDHVLQNGPRGRLKPAGIRTDNSGFALLGAATDGYRGVPVSIVDALGFLRVVLRVPEAQFQRREDMPEKRWVSLYFTYSGVAEIARVHYDALAQILKSNAPVDVFDQHRDRILSTIRDNIATGAVRRDANRIWQITGGF